MNQFFTHKKCLILLGFLLTILSLSAQKKHNFDHLEIQEYERMQDVLRSSAGQTCACTFEGRYLASTTVLGTVNGIGWDACDGVTWEGLVEWELVDDEIYQVFSFDENGNRFDDMSMGAYYVCYGATEESGLPNGTGIGSLRIENNCDVLDIIGASQWGEIYTITEQTIEGSQITIEWTNDYGESARTVLTREDEAEVCGPLCTICSPSDSLALVALYNATDGANWTKSWDLTQPVATWFGITVNDDCCIERIELWDSNQSFTGNNLAGTIPAELGSIASLKVLDLRYNENLTGSIPPALGTLANLEELVLHSCALSGTIPAELGTLDKLSTLWLSSNQLTGNLPIELSMLDSLSILFASRNQLTGALPAEYGVMTTLGSISLYGNELSGTIPAAYATLTKLVNFDVSLNQLSGSIPDFFGTLENLRYLRLGYNQLTGGIPSNLSDLSTLWFLNLENNQLEGTIPEGLSNNQSLFILGLNNNDLTGAIPTDLGTIEDLRYLLLHSNQLTGTIPENLLALDFIDRLYLFDNKLEGCFEGLDTLCSMPFMTTASDTIEHLGNIYYQYYDLGYNLSQNPTLPWGGDLTMWCAGESTTGAPCEDGNPATLDDVIQDDCSCSGIVPTQELTAVEQFYLSPNPVQNKETIQLQLTLNEYINFDLSIYNSLGLQLTTVAKEGFRGDNNYQISLANMPAGIYFLEIKNTEGARLERFIVQ